MVKKSEEDFCFNFISNYDIKGISDHINNFDSEWSINTSRQDQLDPVHKNTKSYFIIGNAGVWSPGKKILPVNVCRDKKLWEMIDPIIKDLERFHDGITTSALIVKLLSENDVLPHVDSSEYLQNVRRNHIAIKTNAKVLFFVEEEEKNIKEGECWEINNAKTHHVKNVSSEERIHLIIDIMPSKLIGDKNV
jgi:hypothetical protein